MMTVRPFVALLAVCAAGCAQTPKQVAAAEQASAVAATDLAKELAGLTPGRSGTCMPPFPSTQVKAFGPTIVYVASNGVKYRSDTAGGCERIARGDILITRTVTGQLCQGDIATTVDSASRTFTGSCSFGPFVRYSRDGK